METFFFTPPISGTDVYFSGGVSDGPYSVFQGQFDVPELISEIIFMIITS